MRASVMPEALRPALALCSKVAAKDRSSGTYSAVELATGAGVLQLRAQDAHVSLMTTAPLQEVKDQGAVLVECSRLSAVLGVRPDGTPLQIWTEGAFLHVKQGEFKAKLPQLRSVMPLVDMDGPFDLDLTVTEKMLHGMLRCRHTVDDEQETFGGMLLDFSEPATLRVAAFTRALLQIAHFDAPAGLPGYRVVVAPRVVPILESLPKSGFRIAFSASRSKVFVFSDVFSARVACLEDRYPIKYQSVLGLYRWRDGVYPIPLMSSSGEVASERQRSQLVFSRQEVLSALESAAVVLGKDDITVEMKIGQRLNDGRVVVELIGSNTSSKSHASEKVLATGNVDAAVSLGLNYSSARAVLRHLDADTFTLHVGRKEDPIVFTEHGSEHIVALATLMRL